MQPPGLHDARSTNEVMEKGMGLKGELSENHDKKLQFLRLAKGTLQVLNICLQNRNNNFKTFSNFVVF